MNVGLGVMIGMLSGNGSSVEALKNSLNKEITKVWLGEDDALHFRFAEGPGLRVADEGQSCCEHRYMVCDDDLSSFVGSKITGMELVDGPDAAVDDERYGCSEVQFLNVSTTSGVFTVASHNEHNGYYGGFWIQCSEEE